MPTALREAWRTLVPGPEGRHGPLPPMLLALTIVTGLVDSVSYLALGHVFVANMTGNVVFVAFALAGASGFSVAASVTALVAFGVGALVGGRIANRAPRHRARLLVTATAGETLLVLAAYLVSQFAGEPVTTGPRYTLIVLLAVALGLQNAAARRLAVPDLTTTVLTLTITGIASDGRIAGGSDSRIGIRALSVAAMFAGALIGVVLTLHGSTALPLLIATVLIAVVTVVLLPHRRSAHPWTT
jgi:uncharacterized membrane protein YoaK (UPF0700 family)